MSVGSLVEVEDVLDYLSRNSQIITPNPHVLVEVNENPGSGYFNWHIPGSVLLRLYGDLLRGVGVVRDVNELVRDLAIKGITRDTHVVLLDEVDNRHAAIAYMVLKALGFRHVSILNGGKANWLMRRGPVCTCDGHVYGGDFNLGDWSGITINLGDYFVNFDQVRELVVSGDVGVNALLVDVRSHHEYVGGEVDIWGHIPGAINMPWNLLLDPQTNRFRGPDEIREVVGKYGLSPSDDIILYCRTGGRSALVWFALTELLGFSRVRVYLGSWLDWLSRGGPIKRGEEP